MFKLDAKQVKVAQTIIYGVKTLKNESLSGEIHTLIETRKNVNVEPIACLCAVAEAAATSWNEPFRLFSKDTGH